MTGDEAAPCSTLSTVTHTTHDAIMPVFCPTEQEISARPKFSSLFDPISTVHGVVFDFRPSTRP
ncbi:hypothetical protein ABIA96_002560 [Bradyrhizobium sp. LB11.1]|jgi:hypothetical protein